MKVLGSIRRRWQGIGLIRKFVIVLVAVLMVAAAGVGSLYYWRRLQSTNPQQDTAKPSLVCDGQSSGSVYTSASKYMTPIVPASSDTAELAKIVSTIESEPQQSYKSEPGCLYVLVVYYTNIMDTTKATNLLQDLRSVNSPEETLTNIFGRSRYTIGQLESRIAIVKQQQDEIKRNMIII